MKKYITTILIAAACTGISSCKKDKTTVATVTSAQNGLAYVQVLSGTVNAARNYVYVDNVPVTGAAIAFGGQFPAAAAYAFGIAGGAHTIVIKDTLATSTQVPLSFQETFESGKKYTIFTYDTITAAKKLTVTDDIVTPTDTTARLRFANLMYNSTAAPNVDVFSFLKNANVFTNIPTATVSPFIPYVSVITDTLYVRETGTSVLLAKVAVAFTKQRSYTAFIRGSYKGTKTAATLISY